MLHEIKGAKFKEMPSKNMLRSFARKHKASEQEAEAFIKERLVEEEEEEEDTE